MKKSLLLLIPLLLIPLLLLMLGGVVAAMGFRSSSPPPAGPRLSFDAPDAPKTRGVRLSAISAGRMVAIEALVFGDGSWHERRTRGVGAILVRHPYGNVLFDTGFGRDVDAHAGKMPWLQRLTTSYSRETPVTGQLRRAGIDVGRLIVVITHPHWDHVSGLADMGEVNVVLTQQAHDSIQQQDAATALIRSFPRVRYEPYNFPGGPYLGFERSFDFFGDGSIVLVPAPGSTPGSIIAFVNASDGGRYALVGDLVWQAEGIDLPAERPWLSRLRADENAAKLRDTIQQLHRLQEQMPELVVVPAHDRGAWDRLPRFPG